MLSESHFVASDFPSAAVISGDQELFGAVAFRQTSGDFAHITLRLRQSEHAECENKTQQDRFSHSFLLECYMDNWILDAVCPSKDHRKRESTRNTVVSLASTRATRGRSVLCRSAHGCSRHGEPGAFPRDARTDDGRNRHLLIPPFGTPHLYSRNAVLTDSLQLTRHTAKLIAVVRRN